MKKRIYFGKDSVFQAVKDTGKPGLSSRKEFIRLVLAQLADVADFKTKDHSGKTVKWTLRLWNGRMALLRLLNKRKKFRLAKLLRYVDKIGKAYLKKQIGPLHLAEAIDRICKKYNVSTREARDIVKKVNAQKKILRKIIKNIDGIVKKEVERIAREHGISRKKAARRAIRLGHRIARKLRSRFDPETKRIAEYLWEMIPSKYKRKPHRIWYYVQVLWLAYYIHKYAKEKGLDWRAIDWASDIDWRQGYRHAKEFIQNILRTGLSRYEDWTPKDWEEYDKYIEQYMEWERQRLAEAAT